VEQVGPGATEFAPRIKVQIARADRQIQPAMVEVSDHACLARDNHLRQNRIGTDGLDDFGLRGLGDSRLLQHTPNFGRDLAVRVLSFASRKKKIFHASCGSHQEE
jgi:hypothetical protein